MNKQIRNGDVFLRPVRALPAGATRQTIQQPEVLAYGEVTGHSHRIISDCSVARYVHDGRAYVLLKQAGILTHEEHGQAHVGTGVYELIIERDYDPSEYPRTVVD